MQFATLLDKTEPGNDGTVAFHYQSPEITPKVMNPITVYFDKVCRGAGGACACVCVRACVRACV